jgi:uracil-DNA glycosylase family 4
MSRSPQHNPQNQATTSSAVAFSDAAEVAMGSLRQVLEMYLRSGLRWYLMPDGTKVNVRDLLQRLDQSSAIAPVQPTVNVEATLAPKVAEPTRVVAETTAEARPAFQPPASKEKKPVTLAPAPQFANWQLPVLTLDQREQNFADLKKRVAACTKCRELVTYRTQTVFGDGTLQPKVCFFGEAPGADEDKQGMPFVGKAGQLLDKIIEATTLKRPDDVYILNSLRCRPPGNRTPTPEEVENCRPFFELQLEVLQPQYIVCLGAVAVRAILQRTESVGMLRGKFHAFRGAKVLVTYHPAYLLRNVDAKKLVWEDMQILMADMGLKRKN